MSDAMEMLERAQRRAEEFLARYQDWVEAHDDHVMTRQEFEPNGWVSFYAVVNSQPPREWAFDISEVLIDLRIALDYAVFASAAQATGQDPPVGADQLEFPIAGDQAWFEKVTPRKLKGLGAQTVGFVRSVQPLEAAEPDVDPLLALAEITRQARHRRVPLMWTALSSTTVNFTGVGVTISEMQGTALAGEVKDGDHIVRLRLSASQMEASAQLAVQNFTTPSFDPDGPGLGNDVRHVLKAVGSRVHEVIEGIEGLAGR